MEEGRLESSAIVRIPVKSCVVSPGAEYPESGESLINLK